RHPLRLPPCPTRRSSDLTFDVTVLEVTEGVIEIQASAGDTRLGGDDFAEALAELVARRCGLEEALADEPRARARLRLGCVEAKRSEEHTSELQSRVDLVC